MWFWGTGAHWWGWLLGFLITVAFWGVLIWLIVALIASARDRRGPNEGPVGHDDPEQILARRFAAGEIDEEEFNRRLEHLRELGLTGAHKGRSGDTRNLSP